MLNLLYGWLVLPESLPRRPRDELPAFEFRRLNPIGSLYGLTRLRNVGVLVAVIALANLAQFILHSTWVLYTQFRFDWGPRETGLSLFVVGLMAALVQGGLLGWLLRQFGERRLVIAGLASGTLAYVAYGLTTVGWLMYAIIFANLLKHGFTGAVYPVNPKATWASDITVAERSSRAASCITARSNSTMPAPIAKLPPPTVRIVSVPSLP